MEPRTESWSDVTIGRGYSVLPLKTADLIQIFEFMLGGVPFERAVNVFLNNGKTLLVRDESSKRIVDKYEESKGMREMREKLLKNWYEHLCHIHNHMGGNPLLSMPDCDGMYNNNYLISGLVRIFPSYCDFRVFEINNEDYADDLYFPLLSTIHVVDENKKATRVVFDRKNRGLKFHNERELKVKISLSELAARTAYKS